MDLVQGEAYLPEPDSGAERRLENPHRLPIYMNRFRGRRASYEYVFAIYREPSRYEEVMDLEPVEYAKTVEQLIEDLAQRGVVNVLAAGRLDARSLTVARVELDEQELLEMVVRAFSTVQTESMNLCRFEKAQMRIQSVNREYGSIGRYLLRYGYRISA